MDTVKYNSLEYRQEYLSSEHWQQLSGKIKDKYPFCQRCGINPSTQVHHIRYRNLVDVRPHDLLALCDACHWMVHKAIDIRILRKGRYSIEDVRRLTNQSFANAGEQSHLKVEISKDMINAMNRLWPNGKKRICGILKKVMPVSFTEWAGLEISIGRAKRINFIIRRFGGRRLSLKY